MREERATCRCGKVQARLLYDSRAKKSKAVVIEFMEGTHVFVDWRAKTVRCMHCNGTIEVKG